MNISSDIVAPSFKNTLAMGALIPIPVSITPTGNTFTVTSDTIIYADGASEVQQVAHYLAERLSPTIGYKMKVAVANGVPDKGNLYLTLNNDTSLGEEGYELIITQEGVVLSAPQPIGLSRGVQTLRQLLPAPIENAAVQSGRWNMATGIIRDYPRFAWRGAMLDVSRHFFKVKEVKRFIDLMAYYKLNRLHLHLTDDQGWRLVIEKWPNLATYGGSTQVGGGTGGYYTQADYSDIVAYAQQQYITIVPEIDMPGHTNAALASYPELNCNDLAPSLYTGVEVGFSTFCVNKDITYTFIEDVFKEVAALTPGPYLHIGGDESTATKHEDYKTFVERVQAIVKKIGKRPVGWEEVADSTLDTDTIVQYWTLKPDLAVKAAKQGVKLIMSPASRAYLDMKYDVSSPLGLNWAGYVNVKDAYEWDPATQISGIGERDVIGVEAPLWSETLVTLQDIEFMAFPRLPGYAEIGWSTAQGRSWDEYKHRLGAHGPRLTALGTNFFRAAEVPWE